jgi:hypothetical protein
LREQLVPYELRWEYPGGASPLSDDLQVDDEVKKREHDTLEAIRDKYQEDFDWACRLLRDLERMMQDDYGIRLILDVGHA